MGVSVIPGPPLGAKDVFWFDLPQEKNTGFSFRKPKGHVRGQGVVSGTPTMFIFPKVASSSVSDSESLQEMLNLGRGRRPPNLGEFKV